MQPQPDARAQPGPDRPDGAGFRPDVEGLRGLAVALVVLFHAGLPVPGGFVGVDVFFVISGFLITGLLLREHERAGRVSLTRFYARRIRRLLPAAAVVVVATLAATWAFIGPLDRPDVIADGAAAALSVSNIRFALAEGDYFAAISQPSPFLHFWSLSVEEQFYLAWPALLLVAGRGRRLFVGLVLGLIVAGSFAANLLLTETAVGWAFYSLPTRAWQLGLGGLLAVLAGQIGSPGRLVAALGGLSGWVALGAIAATGLALAESTPYPGWAALLPTVAAAVLIATGTIAGGPRVALASA
ncbi:MAG TPA: acyltransferase, partial [Candidatus Limnocylindrales bacterium]|nr:acyltransferase [Candidatus Limnocylindrales bacterium]